MVLCRKLTGVWNRLAVLSCLFGVAGDAAAVATARVWPSGPSTKHGGLCGVRCRVSGLLESCAIAALICSGI